MRELQPAHIQRLHRSALGPATPSYTLEMAYIALSPRQLTKAEEMRRQHKDRIGATRSRRISRATGFAAARIAQLPDKRRYVYDSASAALLSPMCFSRQREHREPWHRA